MTKVFLAADHAGMELKEKLTPFLEELGYEVEDCGAYDYNGEDDYPDFVNAAAEKVSKNEGSFAVVIGKSGAGEVIVANKTKGIRAALGFSRENVLLLRAHNDANILSLGSAFVDEDEAKGLVQEFLQTPFSADERHIRRLEKVKKLENFQ